MNWRLAIAKVYIPRSVQKRELALLLDATADAFRAAPPVFTGLSHNECLKLFARFTGEQALESIRQGNEQEIKSRLFQNACRIGQRLKAEFNINSGEEAMQMGATIYRSLKIDFQGDSRGNIRIKHCFFSAYYSSRVCHLISSLDEGLLTGLSGGSRLTFSQRITDGSECCRAYLEGIERTH